MAGKALIPADAHMAQVTRQLLPRLLSSIQSCVGHGVDPALYRHSLQIVCTAVESLSCMSDTEFSSQKQNLKTMLSKWLKASEIILASPMLVKVSTVRQIEISVNAAIAWHDIF